jgi:hypothetical protein
VGPASQTGQGRRFRRGCFSLVVLAALASGSAAWGLAGDETVFAGACAHFLTTVKTSEPSYAPGQTVIIIVTQTNDGPACTIPPQPCGPPWASASARNPAGQDVWDAGAHKTFADTFITCLGPGPVPNWTWTAYESDTQDFSWSEDDCTGRNGLPGRANPGCPGTEVPPGTYRITGEFFWNDGRFDVRGPSASTTITISGRTRALGRGSCRREMPAHSGQSERSGCQCTGGSAP